MTGPLERVAEYSTSARRGDVDAARTGLLRLWEASVGEDLVTRCGIAHALADVQDDPREELRWDEAALAAALEATDEDAAAHGMAQGVTGLMPSLRLNLADVHRRLGAPDAARAHALEARAALAALEPNPYLEDIARSVDRILTGIGPDATP